MTQFNGQIDTPPTPHIAERFSPALAKAVEAYRTSPDPGDVKALAQALSDITTEQVEKVIADRRARIAEALDTLEGEFPRLAEDLAFRDWRNGPIYPYKPKSLTANRRRPKALMHPRELIQDLFAICHSQAGSVQRDSPQGQRRLTIADFAQRPRINAHDLDYRTGAPGSEGHDTRILGGREAA